MPTTRLGVRTIGLAVLLAAGVPTQAAAQQNVTSPEDFFGHRIGADYVLPNYQELTAYWQRLDAESERMQLVDIGETAEGRTQLMAIVTAPQNHANLERYREIAARLAYARGVSDEEARQLAREGKAVVWIDGGLHATEVLGAQQLMETVYQLVSRDDAETNRILEDVIVLAVHANPDGHDLVADWYMRNPNPSERSSRGIPRLYQKYVGHDNNRDFFASIQPETENMNRVLYTQWHPLIMYNHHQSGPSGTVMFAPPFRDPFNYVYDPLIITGLDLVGAAMHNRFVAEDKPGVTMRRGANYSTWWNGGLRTTTYFHNMIGLLTETIGNPTPITIPFLPRRQLPTADLPYPIQPQPWYFRNSVDYSVTANYAVLDVADRYKDTFLYNRWRMGMNQIERGSRDSWTHYPSRVAAVEEAMEADRRTASNGDPVMSAGGIFGNTPDSTASQRYLALLHRPEWRDARGYIVPADQTDFATATKFINALLETGIEVHEATSAFTINGRTYPSGSYVIWTAQAFAPHVYDMFEPQDHPNDFRYPGGPPIPPYDASGWTLAYQMAVDFDRVLEGFDAPTRRIESWNATPPAGIVETRGGTDGWLLDGALNDAYNAALQLIAAGETVFRLTDDWEHRDREYQPGDFYVLAGQATQSRLENLARELGISFHAATSTPGGDHVRVNLPRVALWDRYGGSMPSGWTRWIMEQWHVPFEVVYPGDLDAGNLRERFDVIVFVDGAIPEEDSDEDDEGPFGQDPDASSIPEEYRERLGRVTVATTVPQLREFLEAGGTIVTIGSSTVLARHLGLPIADHLVQIVDGREEPLEDEDYYIPGSVLQVRLDNTRPVSWGMPERVDVFFDNSPVMRIADGAPGVQRLGWFDSAEPLRSGWAWGQQHLQGGTAIAEADVGAGTLYLFGPEIMFRAQPHGTFKLFFNALLDSADEDARIR
ncbi:MAG: M14 family metallopeptidase [Longimicrobiales bacterium]